MPGVDSASKNEHRDTSGGKDGRCKADNLSPSIADVTESGSLNLPEPSGSLNLPEPSESLNPQNPLGPLTSQKPLGPIGL
jgi:hypothetical protein